MSEQDPFDHLNHIADGRILASKDELQALIAESNRKAVEVFANNLKLEIDDVLGGEVIWIREVIDQQIDDLKEPRKEAE